jgi:hypothetical protein
LTGPGISPALNHAFLVELAVVRQIDLVSRGNHLAAVQHRDRIVAALLILARKADHHARPAIRGIGGKLLHRRAARLQEGRLQHQILRRIAGNEKLGEEQQIGALGCGFGARVPGLGKIAGDVADSRIELRNGNAEGVGSGLNIAHDPRLARAARLRNVGVRKGRAALQQTVLKIAGTRHRTAWFI